VRENSERNQVREASSSVESPSIRKNTKFHHRKVDKWYPPTFDASADFIDRDLGIILPIDTVRHLVSDTPWPKVVTGKPMERERVEVNPEVLIDFYLRLRSVMTGLAIDLVFDFDEAGYQGQADRTDFKIIPLDSFERDTVEVPLNRSDNQSSMIICISTGGASLSLLIIVPRATTEQELYEIGYTPTRFSWGAKKIASSIWINSMFGSCKFSCRGLTIAEKKLSIEVEMFCFATAAPVVVHI
jgi:hypothetical protein